MACRCDSEPDSELCQEGSGAGAKGQRWRPPNCSGLKGGGGVPPTKSPHRGVCSAGRGGHKGATSVLERRPVKGTKAVIPEERFPTHTADGKSVLQITIAPIREQRQNRSTPRGSSSRRTGSSGVAGGHALPGAVRGGASGSNLTRPAGRDHDGRTQEQLGACQGRAHTTAPRPQRGHGERGAGPRTALDGGPPPSRPRNSGDPRRLR